MKDYEYEIYFDNSLFQKDELINTNGSNYTFLAQELIAVAYANGATAKAHGDAATMSPRAL